MTSSTPISAPPSPPPTFVYRLLTREEWRAAIDQGHYSGSALDRRDGFIHLSTLEQSIHTARLYFPRHPALLMAQLRLSDLSESVSWDWSDDRRSHFPHYHRPTLDCQHFVLLIEMSENDDGSYTLPPHLTLTLALTDTGTDTDGDGDSDPWLYKISSVAAWDNAKVSGHYLGNEKDLSDGFIHLSSVQQLSWVAKKFTSSAEPLCILIMRASALTGAQLVWEWSAKQRSQSAELGFVPIFAHCYDRENGISVVSVHSVQPITELSALASLIQSDSAAGAQSH